MVRAFASLAVVVSLGTSVSAWAQTDPMAMGRMAAANQLGVLQYCQSQGAVGPDAVSAEREVMARMPASNVSTDSAEAQGKQGTLVGPSGQQITLASLASTHNTTISSLCQQMGSSTLQAASMYRQGSGGMGAIPGMPSSPNGLTGVPGLPSMGAGMTGIPGLPAPPPK